MKISIKETSKSGVIANIDGIFGQLKEGGKIFAPYNSDELAKKTAYKDQYGWKEYSSLEEYLRYRIDFNAERQARNAEMMDRAEAQRIADDNTLRTLISAGPIPATVENVRLLLNHLNQQNWGSWSLPNMTIGYSANQYDCDGVTATTITLQSPISDLDSGIENETRFVTGAPRGHLSKYQRL